MVLLLENLLKRSLFDSIYSTYNIVYKILFFQCLALEHQSQMNLNLDILHFELVYWSKDKLCMIVATG